MQCVECGSRRCDSQRGWVTVLSPSGSIRIHYCPRCMARLCARATLTEEGDTTADDE